MEKEEKCKEEEKNVEPFIRSKLMNKLGACSRPSLVKTSKPGKEPRTPVGGKCAREKRKESTRPSGSLEGWLLPGPHITAGSSVKVGRQREGQKRLVPHEE